MKKILLFGIPIGIALLVAAAYAAPFGWGHRHFHSGDAQDFLSWKLDRLSKELDLNPAQQAKMDDFKKELETLIEERMQKRKEIRNQIAAELQKDNPDVSKVTPLIDEQIDQTAQAAHNLVGRVAGFYNDLSPEQKKEFADHFLKRMHED